MTKPTARTRTTAIVTVTVEIAGIGSWGPECKLDQVYQQAAQQAEGIIRQALGGRGNVIGTAKVKAITTDMEDRS